MICSDLHFEGELRLRYGVQREKTSNVRILREPTVGESARLRRGRQHVSHPILLSLSEEIAQVSLPQPRSRLLGPFGLPAISQGRNVASETPTGAESGSPAEKVTLLSVW